MEIVVSGQNVTITSSAKVSDIELLQKENNKALVLVDENGNETFRVFVGKESKLNSFGITFADKSTNPEGKAQASLQISRIFESSDELKEYIVDTCAVALKSIAKIEAQIAGSIGDAKASRETLKNSIRVI